MSVYAARSVGTGGVATAAVADGGASWWAPTRAGRMAFLLAVLWVLSLADLYFTLWAHRWTPFVEGNPLAAKLLGSGMIVSVVLLKLTTTAAASCLFWRVRHYARAEAALWLVVLGMLVLAVLWKQYTMAAVSHADWIELAHLWETLPREG
ncbi:MAG: DUF5658 family protein [Tepidisphaerales bacterium]